MYSHAHRQYTFIKAPVKNSPWVHWNTYFKWFLTGWRSSLKDWGIPAVQPRFH